MDDDNGWRNAWPFLCQDDTPHAWQYTGEHVPGKPWSKYCLNCFMVKAGNTADNEPVPAPARAAAPAAALPRVGPPSGSRDTAGDPARRAGTKNG